MDPLLEHYMPSLMASKKALPGRQPGSFKSHLFLLSALYRLKTKNKEGNPKLFKKESESEKDKHC